MNEKDWKEKLKEHCQEFKNDESKFRKKRVYKVTAKELLKYFKIPLIYREKFITNLDLSLELKCLSGKLGDLKEIVAENMELLVGKTDKEDRYSRYKIEDYVKSKKLALKLILEEGIEKVNNQRLIINEFTSIYCKYLASFNEFYLLNNCKRKIVSTLKELGISNPDQEDILNEIKYYFHRNTGYVQTKKLLERSRGELLNLSKILAVEITKRIGSKDLMVNEILQITSEKNANNQEVNENKEQRILNSNVVNEDNRLDEKDSEILKKVNKKNKIEVKDLKLRIEELEETLEAESVIYQEEKERLLIEIGQLRRDKHETMDYAKEQYRKAMENLIRTLTDGSYGFVLDSVYKYVKGYDENVDMRAIATNLLSALQCLNILPVEKERVNDEITIDAESVYKYRFNKDISDDVNPKGIIKSPAWFYKNEEIVKEYVEVKGR